jgi:hypothetical protein
MAKRENCAESDPSRMTVKRKVIRECRLKRRSARHPSVFHGMAVCLALCAASPCLAQARPNTTTMSCKAAAGVVDAQGAVVLSTGPTTYDRYVASKSFCQFDEILRPAFVPTADNPQCFIGYYCYPNEDKDHPG